MMSRSGLLKGPEPATAETTISLAVLAAGEVISYLDMCRAEGVNLQRGMNYGRGSAKA